MSTEQTSGNIFTYKDVNDLIGKKKTKGRFLVVLDFHSESFIVKSLKCLLNFTSQVYFVKPWNCCNHFGEHIKPKRNKSLSLKHHRFNRLQDCCLALLYHLDDSADCLVENGSIISNIAICDRWNS